eukprot:13236894-Ditylum_brightwellii.AAC.1
MLPLLNKYFDLSSAAVKLQHDDFPEADVLKHSTFKQTCLFGTIMSKSGEGGMQHENDAIESKDVAPSQITSAFNTSSSSISSVVQSKVPIIAPTNVASFLNVTSSQVPSSVTSLLLSISCFSNYVLLAEAASHDRGRVFTSCPDSVFSLIPPPSSDASSTVTQFRPDGSKKGTYDVHGGSRHFEIAGSATEVELKGLAFIGTTDVTVGVFGSSNASATFDDCDQTDQSVGKAKGSMSVEIPNCTFSDISNLEFDTITDVGGMTLIVDIVF